MTEPSIFQEEVGTDQRVVFGQVKLASMLLKCGGAGVWRGSARDLLLLADTEDDEFGRLDRGQPDFNDQLAFVDRVGWVGLRVALDVEGLVGR